MTDKPQITVIPERTSYAPGREITTDVLIRIAAPPRLAHAVRPPLNLSLVIDRSGSMSGEKMARARDAACYCIDQLLPQDRVSVVIFDDVVEVLVPSQPVEHRESIRAAIRRIEARNSTALHQGWVVGGLQVGEHLRENAVNRVLLITDGCANVGETNTDRIVSASGELAARGVSTSTIGIGRDFNENLLIPMAEAGRGNAWHVEEAAELRHIFETELRGLVSQVGHTVSLGLSLASGVTLLDVLNDFEVTSTGRYKLPNLAHGAVIEVVARLQITAKAAGLRFDAAKLRLAWTPQGARAKEREVIEQSVVLELAASTEEAASAVDEQVLKAAQTLIAARARREVTRRIDRGDIEGARATLKRTRVVYAEACVDLRDDAAVHEQLSQMQQLDEELARGIDLEMTRKKLSYQSYQTQRQIKRES